MKPLLLLPLRKQSYGITFTLLILGFTCLLFSYIAISEVALSKKDKLKAAYLFNFTQYIEWPNISSSLEPGKPIPSVRICADGSPEFLLFLNKMAANKKMGALQKTVTALSLHSADGCELLYVKNSSTEHFKKMENTIIVTDSDKITFPDTAIVFYEKNQNLRFEIDLQQISATQVTVSSELLKLAKIK